MMNEQKMVSNIAPIVQRCTTCDYLVLHTTILLLITSGFYKFCLEDYETGRVLKFIETVLFDVVLIFYTKH